MLAYWLAELGQKNIVGLEKSTIIPSDIASTAHASDFVYNTTHDKLGCWTTAFSRKFYEDNGFFLKKGGLEICRIGDDERWEELKRKVASGKAFGTNVSLISAAEAVEKFPLLEEESMIGAMWDPDAGLVVPRSQEVVNFAVESAKEKGALKTFTNTPATDFEIEDSKIVGVKTEYGTIKTSLPVKIEGESDWIGATAGAMIGGLLASQICGEEEILGTKCQDIAIVYGTIGGAAMGSVIQAKIGNHDGFQYIVNIDECGNDISNCQNDQEKAFVQGDDNALPNGQRVVIIYGDVIRVMPYEE